MIKFIVYWQSNTNPNHFGHGQPISEAQAFWAIQSALAHCPGTHHWAEPVGN